ncbi:MAG: lipocalin family protein, partial [Pseudomonadota bacterium]
SLGFAQGEKLMAFRLRHTDGRDFHSGTWIAPDGTPTPLTPDQVRLEPLAHTDVAGRRVPTSWRLRLDDKGVDVTVEAINPNAFMTTLFPYWEGPVRVRGSHSGRGYLEMTGYE